MLAKGATVAAGAIASVATVAASSAAAQTSTAVQGLTGVGGSVPLGQSARPIDAVRTTMDVVPLEAIQDHSALEDLSRSIDVVERTTNVELPPAPEAASQAFERTGVPSFDEPSITGLRKKK